MLMVTVSLEGKKKKKIQHELEVNTYSCLTGNRGQTAHRQAPGL